MEERSFSAPSPEDEASSGEEVVLSDADAVVRLVLYLSWLRSVGIVTRAIAARFPDSDSWERQMSDPMFHAEIAAFQQVIQDVRSVALVGGDVNLSALERVGGAHIGRALESLALTAERLGVTPDDLLVVLVHA